MNQEKLQKQVSGTSNADSMMNEEKLQKQVSGQTNTDAYSEDDYSESRSSSNESYISYKPPPKTSSVPANQTKITDEILLANQADIDIKRFKGELKLCGLELDYFKIWRQFESWNWVKPHIEKMAKDVMSVKEYLEKNPTIINECPENLLGEKPDGDEVECQICYDDVKIWDAKSLKCNHWFCDDCWKRQIQANIDNGKLWSEFRCLQNKCFNLMNYDFFKSLSLELDKKLMYLYFKKIGQAIAQNSPTIVGCKVKDCDKYIELPYELIWKDFRSK